MEQLRNDNVNDVNPHLISGTLSKKNLQAALPRGLSQVVANPSPEAFKQMVLKSDIIICDVDESTIEEIEYINMVPL